MSARFHGIEQAGEEGDFGAVADLDPLKAQLARLMGEGTAITVAVAVPAGGEG